MKSKMKVKQLLLMASAFVLTTAQALAVTCTPEDFQPICEFRRVEGDRCASLEFFKSFCNNDTDGCNGSCYGFTPPGNWYPVNENGSQYRCRCGCFGEETVFAGLGLDGTSLIAAKEQGREEMIDAVASLDELDGSDFSRRSINGIVYSKDSEPSIRVTTDRGKSIVLSTGHPVVLVRQLDGKTELDRIVAATEVRSGDVLSGDTGVPELVAGIERIDYSKRKLNFNVMSPNPVHHIVSANGLKMGDLALQTRLHSVESRILFRAEVLKDLERSLIGK